MSDRRDLLRGVPLFTGLTDTAIDAIDSASSEVRFEDGAYLAREGEPGETFYVLLEGRARVEQGGAMIRELGAGDFLGEVSLVDGGPRSATVTATEPIYAIEIRRPEFLHLFDRMPVVRLGIVTALAERVRRKAPTPID